MSERIGKINSQNEGQRDEIAAKLKMPAVEADRKISSARKAVDALTNRFVSKDLPSRVGEAVRRDFPEAVPPEELAIQLGITLRRDKKQESGTSRQILFGSIGQSPVVLSTSVYGARGDFVDDIGRAEVWVRAIVNEIPEVGQVLWPIIKYGNLGQQTYFVEPEVSKEQFLDWGGPESMMVITGDRDRHPEAMRAFFSCFTQAIQFLKATGTPVKGGKYLLPRDFAKFGGNAMWESSKSGAGEGNLRIRDLGQWQMVSGKTPDREIITLAYQWAAINQFLGSNIGGVFGTDLEFSESGKGEMANWTDSRFRGQKPYLKSLSKALGEGADLFGFVKEWNEKISPLVQKVSMSPVLVGDEQLPVVPGYSDLVFTGSPIELIEGVLKSHGLWFPMEMKKPKRKKNLPLKGRSSIIQEEEAVMATPEDGAILGAVEAGQKSVAVEMRTGAAEKAGLPAFLEGNELPEGYKRINLVSPAREQLIRMDEAPGSETVCYVGKVGVRLRRKEGGKVFFSLLGFDLPKSVEHYKGPSLGLSTNIGPDGIPLVENEMYVSLFNQDSYGSDEKNGLVKGDGFYQNISLFLPRTKDELGGVGSLSRFSFRIREGDIAITNNNSNDNVEIAVPVAAMAREGEVREGIEAVEDVLTAEERDFGAGLENFKKIEDRVGPVAVEELQRLFAETRSSFSKLPVGSRMRAEAMKGVIGQLGAEGEKLRNAGKKDEEIFGEWLMQVYIPLYRRTGKPK